MMNVRTTQHSDFLSPINLNDTQGLASIGLISANEGTNSDDDLTASLKKKY